MQQASLLKLVPVSHTIHVYNENQSQYRLLSYYKDQVGKGNYRLYGFPSPMKFGILEYGNKDSNLEYFMFFNYLPIYRYIISKGKIAQNCPLPLLNIKIILSIINTKLFYCEFFRLCCIFLHNYSIYTIQFGSIPKSCPYSF